MFGLQRQYLTDFETEKHLNTVQVSVEKVEPSPDGGNLNFSFEQTDRGLYLIKKRYSVEKAGHGSDISGPYWMLIETEVVKGKIW